MFGDHGLWMRPVPGSAREGMPEPLAVQLDTVKRRITLLVSWQAGELRCVSTAPAASHTILNQSRSYVNGQAQQRQIEKE